MAEPSFAKLAPVYRKRWDTARPVAKWQTHVDRFAELIARNRKKYEAVEQKTGVPWYFGCGHAHARIVIAILEEHLAARPYLFGARPAFGDFGLWGQLYNCWTDPTPGSLLKRDAPHVLAWIERMLDPNAEGDFESWDALSKTLLPLLERQIGALFLPWSDANAKALAAGQEEMSVRTPAGVFTQKPQKYHARSLAELRKKYAAVADKARLDPILDRASCRRWLT